MKKITLAITDNAVDVVGKIFRKSNSPAENPSGGATYLVDSFPAIFRQNLIDLKGKFTAGEINLMMSAMKGSSLAPEFAGRRITLNVQDHITLDGAADIYGVDGDALVERIQALPVAQLALLELWIHGFWMQVDDSDGLSLEDYIKPIL